MPEIVRITGDTELEIDELSPENALFGKYEIGRLLGCGAFAKVYHARNIRTGQSVAIKAISKQKIVKGGLVSNIKREISIMHRLRHAHIVKLFEVLATKTKIYFVMEFIKGGELFGQVAKGRLSEDLSRRYFQQLISAVGYCHSHGVFHRDLKPENVLIDEFGELKVADFGLSALKEQIGNDGMLHTLCGTPAYVAPELLAKKGYDGAKVDIWSCGIILYVLNAGYLPFNDTNLMKMYKKIYRGEFKCPKWFSPELRQLLSRLLDTNPETRITVNEILHDNWFTKGGFKELKFHDEEDNFLSMKSDKEEKQGFNFLNAFDLISYSSGFDLSGLFNGSDKPDNGERFVSDHSPEMIIKKLEDIGKREDISVEWQKGWRIEMQGQKSNFNVRMEVHRLTKSLVVVEVRKYGGDDARSCEEMWSTKIQPQLSNLIHRPGNPVSGESIAA